MKNKRLIPLMLAIFLGLVLVQAQASAQEGIRLGRLIVMPSVEYEAQYTDNVFLDADKEKEDTIHLLKPRVVVSYEWGQEKYLEAGLDTIFALYGKYDENNYQVINPFISAGIKTPAGFYVEANESFAYTEDPYSSDNQYNLGQQTERWVNYADLVLGYGFGERYAAELMLANRLERYDAEIHQWQNTIENRYALYLFYFLTPKTSTFVRFGQNYVEYDEQNDGTSVWSDKTSKDFVTTDYAAGVRFTPSGKIRGEIRAGYGTQSFDNSFDPFGRSYEDQHSWIAGTSVEYHFQERSVLTWILNRQFLGSPDVDAASYIRTITRLSLDHRFTERLGANIGLGWARSDYEDEYADRPRKYFDEYMVDAGVEYLILRRLSSGLQIGYVNREAGNSAYEYDEYNAARVSIYLKAEL